MRARLVAFKGDSNALTASHSELRMHFDNNRNAAPDAVEVMVREMTDLEDMLLHGLVQGEVKQRGEGDVKVEVQLRPENAEKMDAGGINPLEHLGEGLGEVEDKGLDDVKIDKS